MWQAWVNGILGIWLIIAAFIKANPSFGLWDNLIVGIVVIIIMFTYIPLRRSWQGWLALILGAWMIVSAFIPGLRGGTAYLWNDLIAGIIVAIAGFAALGLKSSSTKAT
jgi:hypothetical protein